MQPSRDAGDARRAFAFEKTESLPLGGDSSLNFHEFPRGSPRFLIPPHAVRDRFSFLFQQLSARSRESSSTARGRSEAISLNGRHG